MLKDNFVIFQNIPLDINEKVIRSKCRQFGILIEKLQQNNGKRQLIVRQATEQQTDYFKEELKSLSQDIVCSIFDKFEKSENWQKHKESIEFLNNLLNDGNYPGGYSSFNRCLCGQILVGFHSLATNNGDYDSTYRCQSCKRKIFNGADGWAEY